MKRTSPAVGADQVTGDDHVIAASADTKIIEVFDSLTHRMSNVEDVLVRISSALEVHNKCARLEDSFGPSKTCTGLRYGLAGNHEIKKMYAGAGRANDLVVVNLHNPVIDDGFDAVTTWLTIPVPDEAVPYEDGPDDAPAPAANPIWTVDTIIAALGGKDRAMDIRDRFRARHLQNNRDLAALDGEAGQISAGGWLDSECCLYVGVDEDIHTGAFVHDRSFNVSVVECIMHRVIQHLCPTLKIRMSYHNEFCVEITREDERDGDIIGSVIKRMNAMFDALGVAQDPAVRFGKASEWRLISAWPEWRSNMAKAMCDRDVRRMKDIWTTYLTYDMHQQLRAKAIAQNDREVSVDSSARAVLAELWVSGL